MQAAPSAEHYKVSISDLVGKNPKILKSGIVNTTYKHLLPEPNWDDSFKLGNITFYKYPVGGIKVDPGFWEERNITFENITK